MIGDIYISNCNSLYIELNNVYTLAVYTKVPIEKGVILNGPSSLYVGKDAKIIGNIINILCNASIENKI